MNSSAGVKDFLHQKKDLINLSVCHKNDKKQIYFNHYKRTLTIFAKSFEMNGLKTLSIYGCKNFYSLVLSKSIYLLTEFSSCNATAQFKEVDWKEVNFQMKSN